jgi:hypothetical protein
LPFPPPFPRPCEAGGLDAAGWVDATFTFALAFAFAEPPLEA